jgi:hypothetical protein
MSWTSDKTGRPEEDGGHQRINISLDSYTREVLISVENKSNFVEHSICVFTNEKTIHLEEPQESSNDSHCFKDAAIFELLPYFASNSIQQVNASFNFLSNEGGVEFRLVINDNKGAILVEKSSSMEYSHSLFYNSGDLGFKQFEAILRDKDKYIFRFQFRAVEPSCTAYAKNINIFVDLIENPLIDFYLWNDKEINVKKF